MLSIRSAASTSTSEPRPIVTPLELISASASLGLERDRRRSRRAAAPPSPCSVSPPYSAQPRPISTLPMSAISDRSPWPTEPTMRTIGCTPALSSATSSSISSRRTPTPAFSMPLTRESIIARTTSVGSGRPYDDTWSATVANEKRARSPRAGCGGARASPARCSGRRRPRRWRARGRPRRAPRAPGPAPPGRARRARARAGDRQHVVDGQAVAAEERCSRWLRPLSPISTMYRTSDLSDREDRGPDRGCRGARRGGPV